MTSQWAPWPLKSPAFRLFVQLFVQAHIKAPRHWPLWGESTVTGGFPSQRTSDAENVPIWWRHHGTFWSELGVFRIKAWLQYNDVHLPCFLGEIPLTSNSMELPMVPRDHLCTVSPRSDKVLVQFILDTNPDQRRQATEWRGVVLVHCMFKHISWQLSYMTHTNQNKCVAPNFNYTHLHSIC